MAWARSPGCRSPHRNPASKLLVIRRGGLRLRFSLPAYEVGAYLLAVAVVARRSTVVGDDSKRLFSILLRSASHVRPFSRPRAVTQGSVSNHSSPTRGGFAIGGYGEPVCCTARWARRASGAAEQRLQARYRSSYAARYGERRAIRCAGFCIAMRCASSNRAQRVSRRTALPPRPGINGGVVALELARTPALRLLTRLFEPIAFHLCHRRPCPGRRVTCASVEHACTSAMRVSRCSFSSTTGTPRACARLPAKQRAASGGQVPKTRSLQRWHVHAQGRRPSLHHCPPAHHGSAAHGARTSVDPARCCAGHRRRGAATGTDHPP